MRRLLGCSLSTLVIFLCMGCERNGEPGQSAAAAGEHTGVKRAVCVLRPVSDSDVSGTIEFVKDREQVRVTGEIAGLSPGRHGFHVHEFGDLTDREAGKSAGSHYNPTDQPHGHREDQQRHVGDLGNIVADENGLAKVDLMDDVITLNGPHAIIGRSIIIHAQADQFTQPVGDAGARVAGGVIGIAEPE
jgi:Cu-Zn family superoxide dismutase